MSPKGLLSGLISIVKVASVMAKKCKTPHPVLMRELEKVDRAIDGELGSALKRTKTRSFSTLDAGNVLVIAFFDREKLPAVACYHILTDSGVTTCCEKIDDHNICTCACIIKALEFIKHTFCNSKKENIILAASFENWNKSEQEFVSITSCLSGMPYPERGIFAGKILNAIQEVKQQQNVTKNIDVRPCVTTASMLEIRNICDAHIQKERGCTVEAAFESELAKMRKGAW